MARGAPVGQGEFFRSRTVVTAVIDKGVTSADGLMQLANWPYAPAELAPFAAEVVGEAARACEWLAGRIVRTCVDWSVYQRTHPELPGIRWPRVWEHVYDSIMKKLAAEEEARRKAEAAASPFRGLAGLLDGPWLTNARMTGPFIDTSTTEARRKDEVLAGYARAKQQVEDYESELSRLQLEHAEVIRPDARLWWGIGILITFTILGVALPLGVMVTGPRDLAQVRWVLYPFITSLVGLIGYIVLYLIQLTRTKAD